MKAKRIRHCPICGKEYDIPDVEVWVYKKSRKSAGDLYFCSWKCMRRYENDHKPKSERICDAIRVGLAPAEVCSQFCISKRQFEYYRERVGITDETPRQ